MARLPRLFLPSPWTALGFIGRLFQRTPELPVLYAGTATPAGVRGAGGGPSTKALRESLGRWTEHEAGQHLPDRRRPSPRDNGL